MVSEKIGCDIRTDRRIDKHDESIGVPFLFIWLRNAENEKFNKLLFPLHFLSHIFTYQQKLTRKSRVIP